MKLETKLFLMILVVFIFTSCDVGKKQYTVSFETEKGGTVERQLVKENTPAVKPSDPTDSGYTFMGWSSDKELKNAYNFNSNVKSDITLYAKWVGTGTNVYFDWNNGTAKDGYVGDHTMLNATHGQPMPSAYINFVRKGYTFRGVSDKSEYNDITGSNDYYYWSNMASARLWDKTDKNPILYGIWAPFTYTATLDSNGGFGGSESVIVTHDLAMPKANKPLLFGYHFDGYFDSKADGTQYYTSTMASAKNWDKDTDASLWAYWTKLHSFYFDNMGGTGVNSLEVRNKEAVAKPIDPEKKGHNFEGWYKEKAIKTPYSFDSLVEDTTTVYARWALKTYNVALDAGEGSGGSATVTTTYQEPMPRYVVAPSRAGYDFEGYYSGNTRYYNAEMLGQKNWDIDEENPKLTAKWLPKTYNVSLDANGGKDGLSAIAATYGEPMPFAKQYPTREGFIFNGYFENTKPESTQYYSSSMTSTNNWNLTEAKPTIYAQWNVVPYTLTYKNANNEIAKNPTTYTVQDTVLFADPGLFGYTFVGWFDAPTGGLKVVNLQPGTIGDKTLYARWTADEYTISYHVGDATNDNPTKYDIESAITLKTPKLEGYVFGGWFTDSAYTSTPVTSIKTGSTGDLTLYAKWMNVDFAITYSLNGGTNNDLNPTKFTVVSDTITLKDPTQIGYLFGGWYTDSTFTGTAVTSIAKGSIGNRTLFAKWISYSYAITYSLNGGTGKDLNPAKYTINSATITLTNPTRIGYNFSGWYDDSTFAGTAVTAINAGSTGDRNLYAKWVPKTTLITLNLQNSDYEALEVKATYDAPMPVATTPTLLGFRFLGYYDSTTNGNQYYDENMKSSNIWDKESETFELFAYWEQIKYIIYFDAQGGFQKTDPVWVVAGDLMPKLDTKFIPTRAGNFTFAGYYDKPMGEGTMYYDSALNSTVRWFKTKDDATLYAYWVQK
jgi:uncharacterized repeat protein (TIGR02543 family)